MKTKLLFLYIIGSVTCSAQIQITQYTGKVIPIITGFPETGFSSVTEFNLVKQTEGEKYWHQSYFYPKVGCSLAFSQYGNWQVLGMGLSVLPNITLSKKLSNNWSFSVKTGLGIAFFNRPFDALTNPDNIVFGSHTTSAVNGEFGFSRTIQKIDLNFGGSIWHWSNGHSSVPNVGGNFIGFYFGLGYHKNKPQLESNFIKDSLNHKIHFDFGCSLGIQEIEGTIQPTDGPRYPIYSITVGATKRLGAIHKLTAGVDVNYFTSYHEMMINQEIFSSNYRMNSFNVVGFIGDEFLFGRLSLVTQIGINLWNPYRKKVAEFYNYEPSLFSNLDIHNTNKIGFRYYWSRSNTSINKRVYTEIGLKTIFGKADFVYSKIGFNI